MNLKISCCVKDCSSVSTNSLQSIHWFELPQDIQLRNSWIASARLNPTQVRFFPNDIRICSLHFKPSDIQTIGDDVKLEPKAVPSRFPWLDRHIWENIKIADAHRQKENTSQMERTEKDMSPALNMDVAGDTAMERAKRKNIFDSEVSAEQSIVCKKPKLETNGDIPYGDSMELFHDLKIKHLLSDTKVRIAGGKLFLHALLKHLYKSSGISSSRSENVTQVAKKLFHSTVRTVNDGDLGNEDSKNKVPCNNTSKLNKKTYTFCDNEEKVVKLCNDAKCNYLKEDSVIRITDMPMEFVQKCVDQVPNRMRKFQSPLWKGLEAVQNDNLFVNENIRKYGDGLNTCQDFIISGKSKWTLDTSLLPQNMSIPAAGQNAFIKSSMMYPSLLQEKQEVEGIQYVSEQTNNRTAKLPPEGPLEKKPLIVNSRVYAMKTNLLQAWVKGVIIKDEVRNGEAQFKIRIDRTNRVRWCSHKMVAYEQPPDVRLTFCRRVIALFTPEDKTARPAMYAGVIGELPKVLNQFRYLIFFDDGIAQYVAPENVRVIYEESKNVWEDVAEENRAFIKKIIEDYPEKIMLRVKKGQLIKSEYEGRWVYAKVMTVDGSMVKLLFEGERRYEWLYRGSTRLEALYKELENARQNQLTGRVRRHTTNIGLNRGNLPYVEYTQNQDVDEIVIDSDDSDGEEKTDESSATEPVKRNVARKSTTQIKKVVVGGKKASQPISSFKEGRIETFIEDRPAVIFKKHPLLTCSRSCLQENDRIKYKFENPLCIPLRFGFERRNGPFRRRGVPRNNIYYRAPCGRMLRNFNEILLYLTITNCQLTIDMFSLDPDVIPNRFFRITKEETLWSRDDITEGVEKLPIPCVNCLTNESPPYVKYANEPFPGRGVTFTTDNGFLCGCDCTDNCQDSTKCQCQLLTASVAAKPGEKLTQTGYKYRRLTEPVLTAIYECNSQCSCNKSCVNRVVQNGIQVRLQMFKTEKKGWGVRCLDDLDAGTFLTIYAGQVQTDAAADEDGIRLGDEYLADLDHIEVAESHKIGYEAEAFADDEDYENKPVTKEVEEDDDFSDTKSMSSTSSDSSPDLFADSDYEESFAAVLLSDTGGSTRSTRSKKKTSSENAPKTPESKGPSLFPSVEELSPGSLANLKSVETREPNFGMKHTGAVKKSSGPQRPGFLYSEISQNGSRTKGFTIRSYFNEKDPYIMDAKIKGNIGRYLNHSCCPNSFVQNVFLETHDLRFPTVAFFTLQQITAGTELTWDYSYEIGSVQGKKLICHCGTSACRGRLL